MRKMMTSYPGNFSLMPNKWAYISKKNCSFMKIKKKYFFTYT